MKFIASHFLIFYSLLLIGQENPNCKADSLKKITFCLDHIRMEYVSESGDLIPIDYDSLKYDFYDPDRLVMVEKNGSLFNSKTAGRINIMFTKRTSPTDNYRFNGGGSSPDSLDIFENSKIEEFILKHKDSLILDTLIFLDRGNYFNKKINNNLLYKCTYKFDLKHGDEFYYYSIPELKNICLVKNFKVKIQGKWRKGKKHGRWIEYDKSGEVLSVKKFKRDRLIKERYP